MICRNCKNELPPGSLYCMYCGKPQVKIRQAKQEVKVPDPRKLPSGKWFIQLRLQGRSIPVTEATESACRAKAIAIKAGILDEKKIASRTNLRAAMDKYIEDRTGVLSGSTISGYKVIARTRFLNYACQDARSVNWQRAVQEEAALCSAKTLKNAWGFAAAALRNAGIETSVTVPAVPVKEMPWLDADQVRQFLGLIYGRSYELPALLALHGLRKSEVFGLTWENVSEDGSLITVRGAKVRGADGKPVLQPTNKTALSTRQVPVVIPRLKELLLSERAEGPVVTCNITTPQKSIKALCERNGLPPVGMHGLRHTFCSLCYYCGIGIMETCRLGGWSNVQTVNKVYTHLSAQQISAGAKSLQAFFNGENANENANENRQSIAAQ